MHPQSSRPLLVYDNDCDFCRYWIAQWQHATGDRIDYAPYQEVAAEFPEIPLSAFENSVQLILQNGTVLSGAEAVFRALNNGFFLGCYYHLPGFASVSEWVYRFVAQHRPFFSALTCWFWGTHTERTTLHLSRWLFLRGLGCIYLIAFPLSVGTNSRIGWKQRNFASRTVSISCSSTNRNGRLLSSANTVLVESIRRLPPLLVCGWCCPVFSLNCRFFSNFRFSRFMGILPIACNNRAGFSQLPVGCVALRSRTFGNLFRAATHP